jgi:hypothetical protein
MLLGKIFFDIEFNERIVVVFVEDNTRDWRPRRGGGNKCMSVVNISNKLIFILYIIFFGQYFFHSWLLGAFRQAIWRKNRD